MLYIKSKNLFCVICRGCLQYSSLWMYSLGWPRSCWGWHARWAETAPSCPESPSLLRLPRPPAGKPWCWQSCTWSLLDQKSLCPAEEKLVLTCAKFLLSGFITNTFIVSWHYCTFSALTVLYYVHIRFRNKLMHSN